VTEEQARASWSVDLAAAEPGSELEAALVRVGQKQGSIEGGKLKKPDAPLGSVERLNEDLRATQAPDVIRIGHARRTRRDDLFGLGPSS
jgi:hypothetical protein